MGEKFVERKKWSSGSLIGPKWPHHGNPRLQPSTATKKSKFSSLISRTTFQDICEERFVAGPEKIMS